MADSYIQISSGFVQLATVENTELDKYVHYEMTVTIHLNEYLSIFNSVLTSIFRVYIHVLVILVGHFLLFFRIFTKVAEALEKTRVSLYYY